MKEGYPVWYELMVADPAAVAGFYRDAAGLGWPDEGGAMPNGATYRSITRADGSAAGGLLGIDMPATWVVYFQTADVDAAVEKATSLGAVVHMPANDVPGAGRIAMLADPQGAIFYLIRPQPPEGADLSGPGVFEGQTVGHWAWNELNTDNAAVQLTFYSALFGWTVADEMEMPGDHSYKMMDCGGTQIGAICSMKPEGAPSAWLPYLRVSDVAASADAVKANGGSVLMGPHDVPGGDRILVAIDPAGAALGLVSKAK